MTNSIEIRGLCKSYRDFALRDVSFTLPGGAIMGLIGENGAGKTTTIKCILNLIDRDSGSITLMGHDNLTEEQLVKQDIGVVLDECFFHDTLRPRDLCKILAPVWQDWDSGLFRDYLDKFKLPEKQFIKEFSRGMKMKLSLAAALAHRPRLLILDEATAGLDPVVRDEILEEFLSFICDEDHAILLSSHITSDLEKVADSIAYLHKGRLLFQMDRDELLEKYGVLRCSPEQLEVLDNRLKVATRKTGFTCETLVNDAAAARRALPDAVIDRASIEDIMQFYTGRDAQ